MDQNVALRKHLVYLLRGGGAHVHPPEVLQNVPLEAQGKKVAGAPYTLWQLLEHMRIAQWDILEFSRNPRHQSPPWPEGYWPQTETPPDEQAWSQSTERFLQDLEAMIQLVEDPDQDLFSPFPHGTGQTLLREALLVADHNAYHLGQMVLLRRMLGIWPGSNFSL